MTHRQHAILVVDDLPDWRTTLSGMLAEAGYKTRTAGSQAEALNLLETDHFDLALLDMRLDESDENNTEGLDLASRIRHRWPAIKVVIITGYGVLDTVKRAMEPDAQGQSLVADFIAKTETDKLTELVKRVLGADEE